MCGINGIIQFKQSMTKGCLATMISQMNDCIVHRGPDDHGIYIDNHIALGMRRLSIIDLSTGKQPIFSEDKSLVIVFNGEIYNYKELKQNLLDKGHKFITNSDTEVILHAYEEYSIECLHLFDGMFAFAIYDLQNQELLIARDRAGEKPLYYQKTLENFIFGSELKSLISTGLVKRNINSQALYQYFQLTYIPAPLSIFENVFKLPAAHYLKISHAGDIEIKQYWDMVYDHDSVINDYSECKRLLRDALFSSVERRMISDVPLGAFLSGGIDSTIITGIMSKLSSRPIDTFTIGFKNKQYDESDRAKVVSDFHKTNHHVYFLDYTEALDELENIIGFIDEPFADSSAIPTYIVSKYAGQYVKVVLTGDGGDELFAGYSKYLIDYYTNRYNRIPKILRKNLIERLLLHLPAGNKLSRKVRKVIFNSSADIFEQRCNLMTLGLKANELHSLVKSTSPLSQHLNFIREYYDKYKNVDELSQALYADFKVVLEGDMLAKVDRMSMANSIETRVPMLAKDVIEVAAKIPGQYKITRRQQKIILKETFADLIPPLLLKAEKQGFSVPIRDWFRGPLKSLLGDVLNRDMIESQGLFEYKYVEQLMHEHFARRIDRSSELWSLFVFQKWYLYYSHA